ncbi:hypothetical protein ACFFS2_24845 [Streptomyces aurantiacus]|uniref:Uncharacterized protein n=1 Tax=Streptomyces aurantiacus TaxID=47760 RepID=A0A7G1P0R3_9ACTN|nr:hypothetical protein [Streptomyces aurantiacus]BCL27387.1 hypothetical protein GCM10017557_22460 [Streptomyces aurantiacus]
MDAGMWVGAASGLAGAAVGAAGAIISTTIAHRHQRSLARDQRRAELAKEAADTLTTEFVALLNLARRYPEEGASEDEMLPFRKEAMEHHLRIEQALVRLPDDQLRTRLGDVMLASMRAFQSAEDDYRTRRIAAYNVSGEAISCLGASLREQRMPRPTPQTADAQRRRLELQARHRLNSASIR